MNEKYDPSQVLSSDPKLIRGQLDNGFEYLIRANPKPKERAHFQLVVKAGSLLEEEDQRGLAHILEHMAFNGSTNFKAGDLIEYFTSIGMRFGAHLNAMTSFEKTIYKLLYKQFKVTVDGREPTKFEGERHLSRIKKIPCK